jgi:hypothetical protein
VIRYVDLGDQIVEGFREFAWYDTVKEEFLNLDGTQTWNNWREFQAELVMWMVKGKTPEEMQNEMLLRFRKLFPKLPKQTSPA